MKWQVALSKRPGILAFLAVMAVTVAMPVSADAQRAPQGFFGVVPQEPLSGGDYRRLAEGRIGTVRIPFNWAAIQYTKGKCKPTPAVHVCNWTDYDELIARLATVGVRVLPTVGGTPPFVSRKHTTAPPLGRHRGRWKAFLKAAAKRYGDGGAFWKGYGDEYGAKPQPITHWQIWNEPNGKQFWHPGPQPRRYAKLVKASAKSLREGDKQARVVLGGMFVDAKMPLRKFMGRFYRVRGVKRQFDEIAIHPYSRTIKGLKRQLRLARRVAKRGKNGEVGIRVTELGWSSERGGHPLMKGTDGQASILDKAFRVLVANRDKWNVTGVSWFALRDTNNRLTCKFCLGAGLLEVDGAPKPSWERLKQFSE